MLGKVTMLSPSLDGKEGTVSIVSMLCVYNVCVYIYIYVIVTAVECFQGPRLFIFSCGKSMLVVVSTHMHTLKTHLQILLLH